MAKAIKRALAAILVIVGILLLTVLGYVSYLFIDYSRIEDNKILTVRRVEEENALKTGETYTVFCQNIGFGAYTPDFTFFMDGGKESWAKSEASVIECVTKAAETAESFNPDFILFQEVDTDSTRSYHIDERRILEESFSGYSAAFAENYHSSFLFYPFDEPHGASNSGILTLSRYNIDSSVRRRLPISEGITKFLDLDRCYSVSRIPTENGKELVLYNVHLSAYGGSPTIREAQMTMLFSDMQAEIEKGNYTVCGGDFNHDFTGNSIIDLNGEKSSEFDWAQPFPAELLPTDISRCVDYTDNTVPTCRNCDVPYETGNFTVIVDGFLVSSNVEAVSISNVDTQFEYSDHNPVVLEFSLK